MEFDYETKSADYFTLARQEMMPFLPPTVGGCWMSDAAQAYLVRW